MHELVALKYVAEPNKIPMLIRYLDAYCPSLGNRCDDSD
jgi:hypothetical protein